MMKVNNKKTIRNLSFKSLKAAKMRNIMAIIAIALTTVLFTSLFTLGIGVVDGLQQSTMRQAGTSAHGVIKYIDDETYEIIKEHIGNYEIGESKILAERVNNEAFYKRHGEFWYHDENNIKWGFQEPAVGNIPIAENEIMTDTKTLDLLGVPHEIGAPIALELTVKGEEVIRDFILSGWWETDPGGMDVGILITSRAYVDAHSDELYYSYDVDRSMTGAINANLMFDNSMDIQGKLNKVIGDSGFQNTDEDGYNFIQSNINWSYLSSGASEMDITTTLILVVALLIIAFSGYLIIYNIFQISVLRDIRFYGLLKTIGTTGKQIKRIISQQALFLSVIGIPIGMIIGYLIGLEFVPKILSETSAAGFETVVKMNPLIFIGAGIFSLLTVWISTRKPGKIAASVSPIEAVKYSEVESINRKYKKSTNGGKTGKMAIANLGRNKKRTILVLISLSLSLVLLNSVFTLSRGMDMDKFLSTFSDTDFLIGHAEYFNSYFYRGEDSVADEGLIKDIESQEGFLEGGKLYNPGTVESFTVEDANADSGYNIGADNNPWASVYGLDDLPLGRFEVLEGEVNIDKLKSGKYIIYAISTDDNKIPQMQYAHFGVGDKVVLHNEKYIDEFKEDTEYTTNEYEVIATVKEKFYTASDRFGSEYTFYLPSEVYLPLTYNKAIMTYAYNVKDGYEDEMEDFINNATEKIYPTMHYESKNTHLGEFEGTRTMFLSIGGILSFIVGFIGILNFINAMLTSIITRRREFAMLQSIGMTNIQIRNMLCIEGLYYALGTMVLSLILGVLTSIFILKPMLGSMWFMSYKFVITPIIVSWPFLVVFAVAVPIIALKAFMKDSIVDRMREAE
ncbi:MAG: ABC transporter permease [Tissierellia bacterium]|nr:ABC transporter permease [Tissierellia bacterium]